MSKPTIPDELSMDSPLSPRVAALEVSMRSISNEVEAVKTSLDRLSSNVVAGFAEIRRDTMASGRVNWGWIIAAIAVVVALVGAIGSAWVRPLQLFDELQAKDIAANSAAIVETRDLVLRTNERMAVYRELGVMPPAK